MQLRMKSWQDRGCQQKARLLGGHEELVRGLMTSKSHYRAEEGMVEACCAMQMREAHEGAQGRLGIENQLRWRLHHERT